MCSTIRSLYVVFTFIVCVFTAIACSQDADSSRGLDAPIADADDVRASPESGAAMFSIRGTVSGLRGTGLALERRLAQPRTAHPTSVRSVS